MHLALLFDKFIKLAACCFGSCSNERECTTVYAADASAASSRPNVMLAACEPPCSHQLCAGQHSAFVLQELHALLG